MDWFRQNIEEKFKVCWKDAEGHHLSISPSYHEQAKVMAITFLYNR